MHGFRARVCLSSPLQSPPILWISHTLTRRFPSFSPSSFSLPPLLPPFLPSRSPFPSSPSLHPSNSPSCHPSCLVPHSLPHLTHPRSSVSYPLAHHLSSSISHPRAHIPLSFPLMSARTPSARAHFPLIPSHIRPQTSRWSSRSKRSKKSPANGALRSRSVMTLRLYLFRIPRSSVCPKSCPTLSLRYLLGYLLRALSYALCPTLSPRSRSGMPLLRHLVRCILHYLLHRLPCAISDAVCFVRSHTRYILQVKTIGVRDAQAGGAVGLAAATSGEAAPSEAAPAKGDAEPPMCAVRVLGCDALEWDGMCCDGMRLSGMGWDGMEWDAMGCDGMVGRVESDGMMEAGQEGVRRVKDGVVVACEMLQLVSFCFFVWGLVEECFSASWFWNGVSV